MSTPKYKRLFQPLPFSGWKEFRYGTPSRRVTAQNANKVTPVVTGDRRREIISSLLDEMRCWRRTPFEYEAEIIAALRSAWCLEGYAWCRSDVQARVIVDEVLKALGAKRPNWDEGQRWYAERRDNCVACGCIIERSSDTKGISFCSALCAKSALERNDSKRRNESDKLYAAAQRIIKKTRTRPRTCAYCAAVFHPVREMSSQSCCSQSCASKMKHSKARTFVFINACQYCGNEFGSQKSRALYCSNACSLTALKEKSGRLPRHLKPHVFDRHFSTPLNRASAALSTRAFDWLVLRAGYRITCQEAAADLVHRGKFASAASRSASVRKEASTAQ